MNSHLAVSPNDVDHHLIQIRTTSIREISINFLLASRSPVMRLDEEDEVDLPEDRVCLTCWPQSIFVFNATPDAISNLFYTKKFIRVCPPATGRAICLSTKTVTALDLIDILLPEYPHVYLFSYGLKISHLLDQCLLTRLAREAGNRDNYYHIGLTDRSSGMICLAKARSAPGFSSLCNYPMLKHLGASNGSCSFVEIDSNVRCCVYSPISHLRKSIYMRIPRVFKDLRPFLKAVEEFLASLSSHPLTAVGYRIELSIKCNSVQDAIAIAQNYTIENLPVTFVHVSVEQLISVLSDCLGVAKEIFSEELSRDVGMTVAETRLSDKQNYVCSDLANLCGFAPPARARDMRQSGFKFHCLLQWKQWFDTDPADGTHPIISAEILRICPAPGGRFGLRYRDGSMFEYTRAFSCPIIWGQFLIQELFEYDWSKFMLREESTTVVLAGHTRVADSIELPTAEEAPRNVPRRRNRIARVATRASERLARRV